MKFDVMIAVLAVLVLNLIAVSTPILPGSELAGNLIKAGLHTAAMFIAAFSLYQTRQKGG